MTKDPKVSVEPVDARRELAQPAQKYAALIASVGYEDRATYVHSVANHSAFAETWAYEFEYHHVLNYPTNHEYFSLNGTIVNESDSAYSKHLEGAISARTAEVQEAQMQLGLTDTVRYAVDISSMDRDRIARTLHAFSKQVTPIEVDFYYACASFEGEDDGSQGRVTVNRSAEGFEGWTADPSNPLVCIIGLGFEGRLALAALETLEPAQTIWLMPSGLDGRYDELVLKRNRIVVEAIGSGALQPYSVLKPYELLVNLEATVGNLIRANRVVLVPLGPKIFALASMVTALVHPTNVSVWRLSADAERDPVDRRASGDVVALRCRFTPGILASEQRLS